MVPDLARAPAKAKAAGKAAAATATRPLRRKVPVPPRPAEVDTDAERLAQERGYRRGLAKGEARVRARAGVIMTSEPAKAHFELARYLAFETDTPAAEAAELLTMTVAVAPPRPRIDLADRMAMRSDPRPGADGGPEPSGRPPTLGEKIQAAKGKLGLK